MFAAHSQRASQNVNREPRLVCRYQLSWPSAYWPPRRLMWPERPSRWVCTPVANPAGVAALIAERFRYASTITRGSASLSRSASAVRQLCSTTTRSRDAVSAGSGSGAPVSISVAKRPTPLAGVLAAAGDAQASAAAARKAAIRVQAYIACESPARPVSRLRREPAPSGVRQLSARQNGRAMLTRSTAVLAGEAALLAAALLAAA